MIAINEMVEVYPNKLVFTVNEMDQNIPAKDKNYQDK